jgi:hypothetical protein
MEKERILSMILKKADRTTTMFQLMIVQSELDHYFDSLTIVEKEFALEHMDMIAKGIIAENKLKEMLQE